MENPTTKTTQENQFCTFYLEKLFFGIEVEKVQEIIRYQKITHVPLSSPEIAGLINLRSQIVTAIDLRRRLNLTDNKIEKSPLNVVVRFEDETISLLVDEVGDVIDVSQDNFELPPETLRGKVRELIRGAYKLEKQLLLILDVEKVVDMNVAEK
ncbi:MAG: chemotaxis protein CheW [Okeania sp. SIO3I5]|uniref:chemotaxis protein CheW n=1 Tax=Okeania sp. SIO3I5 TaxID=2607805 RepID=UPI0013BBF7D8|nr:chemotaxis protein CheW [Okeania sp. SIO3I5]NEQ36476.1 chemotaxis protein CheW [Okeania sp. SIO3I5]